MQKEKLTFRYYNKKIIINLNYANQKLKMTLDYIIFNF